MIKLIDLLKEEIELTPRRSREERSRKHLIATQKKIKQYIKNGSEGNLDLRGTPITSLPQGLTVGGSLHLDNTSITSIPQDLEVGGSLDLNNTPIAKKYTEEQIKQMVPNLKGRIYI